MSELMEEDVTPNEIEQSLLDLSDSVYYSEDRIKAKIHDEFSTFYFAFGIIFASASISMFLLAKAKGGD